MSLSKNTQLLTPILISCLLYGYIAYSITRMDFYSLILSVGLLFVMAYRFYILAENRFGFLVAAALVFRLLFLGYTPTLSQDYFRFIWDGRLLADGFNPYLYLPNDLISSKIKIPQAQQLYDGMGSLSAKHFSNYPPVNQWCFALGAWLSNQSIFGAITVFRVVLIAADFGVLYFGRKLLMALNQNPNRIFLYLLNPLVIIELTGNLHFEGLMLFFVVAALYYVHQNKWFLASVLLAISVSVKLLPLILIAVLYQKLKWRKFLYFGTSVVFINMLLFLPFLSEDLIDKYTQTISLWFTDFEFNASVYYIVRAIGYQITGYNVIQSIGKFTPFVVILMVLLFSYFKKNKTTPQLISTMLLVLSCYFLLSTTVHPWYLISLVILSVFTPYRFAYIWSAMVFLSYYTYAAVDFKENYYLIAIEYLVVIAWILYETRVDKLPQDSRD